MYDLIIKYKFYVGIAICLFIFISLYFLIMPTRETGNKLELNALLEDQEEIINDSLMDAPAVKPLDKKSEITTVFVDVKGAVVNPGVYELNGGSRIKDAIVLAGGLNTEGDMRYVNLAALLVDEMVIYVPEVGEEVPNTFSIQEGSSNSTEDLISINKASIEQLQTLPGIGPAKAAAIIEYREQNGGFTNIDELLSIPGIGNKTLDKFRDKITTN
jgi:competence protein ComEA